MSESECGEMSGFYGAHTSGGDQGTGEEKPPLTDISGSIHRRSGRIPSRSTNDTPDLISWTPRPNLTAFADDFGGRGQKSGGVCSLLFFGKYKTKVTNNSLSHLQNILEYNSCRNYNKRAFNNIGLR